MKVKRGEQVFSSEKFRRIASTVRQRKLKRKAMRKKGKKKNVIVEVKATKSVPSKPRKSKKKRLKEQKDKAAEARRQQLMEGAKEDDRIIKQMEKRLGLKKRKRKSLPASFQRDGLDYLLDVVEGKLDDKTTDLATILKEDESDEEGNLQDKSNATSQSDMEKDDKEDLEDMNDGESGDDVEDEGEGFDMIDAMAEEVSDDEVSSSEDDDNINDAGEDVGDECHSRDDNDGSEDESDYDSSFIDDDDEDEVMSDEDEAMSDDEGISDKVLNGDDSEKVTSRNRKPVKQLSSESENDSELNEEDTKTIDDNPSDGVWEDIYGRKRDKEGNVIQEQKQKYVPPGKRDSKASDSLKRQIKGHLNRLSEANMHVTVSQLEKLYASHSRHDVNDTLTQLILDAVCQPTLTPERLVMEHAVLVAALHANIGTECGAHILHKVVSTFHEMYKDPTVEKQGKKIHNTAVLLSHLYTFKVCNSSLIYDVLNLLGQGEELSSLSVELILLMLRSVGFLLRKDESVKLKDLVILLQEKASRQQKKEQDSRVNWMLETLLAVRNNNMRKIPQYDPSTAEQLRKVLKTETRKGASGTPLAVTLEDLLQVETRGRWWVVGSSWSGKAETAEVVPSRRDQDDDDELLNLAKKQRMSTDIRKRIFCTIMGAEDYMDAMERLLKLGLDGSREKEILHVLVDCCAQEKAYNPYYAYVAQALCQHHRRFMMGVQFALWDRIKELDSLQSFQRNHLALFTAHLLHKQALPLSSLKVIEYSELDKTRVKFLRCTLQRLLIDVEDDETCTAVFKRVSKGDKLNLLREGLKLFLRHFLLKRCVGCSSEREILEKRMRIAENALKGGSATSL